MSRYLTLVGVLLVGGSVVHLAYSRVLRARAIARSTLVQNLERPVPLRATSAAADPAPGRGAAAGAVSHVSLAGHPATAPTRDVFIILLDEYPSAQVLSERFGIDNRPFEDSLRTLGFRIPAELRSNYANTLMSISSFLNFAHTSALAQVMSPSSHDFGPAAYLIQHNRIGRFLKARGYRYVFFPSSWYGPTVDNPDADVVFRLDSSFDVGNAMQRSELASYFTWSTLFRTVRDRFPTEEEVHTADAAHTFAGIAALPRGPRPTFVLAHVLMPHIPYIEDSSCHALPRNGKIYKDASPGGRAALTAELYCLNHQILTTVHTILDHSTTPPIIILEGDHGTQSLHIFGSMTALPTTAQSRERFRPFGAYYLPDGGGATIPDSVSLVNILRYVLNDYFGANLPLLPNTMYYSHWERPYRLTEVDANFHVVRPGAPAASAPMGDTARAAQ